MNILLSITTRHDIDNFLKSPGHALGIYGPNGSGKLSVAEYISAKIQKNNQNIVSSFYIVRPNEKSTITIEQARNIANFYKLKPAKSGVRIALIENAHSMTIEAQNSLLKLIEEPPEKSLIILTASNHYEVLPTIQSRLQSLEITPPNKQQAIDFFTQSYTQTEVEKAWIISGGRIGLMTSLLNNKDHQLMPAITQAKLLLTTDTYDKLISIDEITKMDINLLLDALRIVSTAGFRQALKNNNERQISRWHQIRQNIYNASNRFQNNTSHKLILTNLMLSL